METPTDSFRSSTRGWVRGVLSGVSILLAGPYAFSTPADAQSNVTPGDVSGPREAVRRLIQLSASSGLTGDAGRALLAGELEEWRAASMGDLPQADTILLLNGRIAVARLPAKNESRPDIYLYMNRGEGGAWTITAFRSLALMDIPMQLRDLLRAQTTRTTEEEETLRNIELTLSSDGDLRRWFATHRAELERLRELAEAHAGDAAVDTPETRAALARIHVLSLTRSANAVIRVIIGGMVDNEVGFLHAPDASSVPPIDPGDHIWIEPVGDGWYLYKTT
jgi:hypothetical protein